MSILVNRLSRVAVVVLGCESAAVLSPQRELKAAYLTCAL